MPPLEAVFTCLILILCCAHLINARPVHVDRVLAVGGNFQPGMPRLKRQVVQPTWLTDKSRPTQPTDGTVHINQQNLQEAAEWRDAIQTAVDEGRFAVDIDQNQQPLPPPINVLPKKQPAPLPPPPFVPLNPAQWWLPRIGPWLPMGQQQQQPQPQPLQRMLSDFVQNTLRMWNRN